MRKIEFGNILKLCKFNLFTNRKVIIGWSVAITALMTLYMILFPSIQDMAQLKMEAMPQELLQFVGMEDMSDMANYTTYYGMIYGIILIAVSIFSATFAAGLIVKEEKTKTIEFLNALAVSRGEIYISKYLTATIGVGIVLACAVISTIICGWINGGETFVLWNIITSSKTTSFTALFFGGIALCLAAVSPKLGSGAMVSIVVIISYMLGYLGELLGSNAEILLYFSPFISFSVENSIEMSSKFFATLGVYLLLYIVAFISGYYSYQNRDF